MSNRNAEREAEVTAQLKEEHEAIQAAKSTGFMDCRDIRDALGYDQGPIQEQASLIPLLEWPTAGYRMRARQSPILLKRTGGASPA